MTTLFILVVFGLLGWLWISNLRAREIAIRAAREACAHQHLQLLDGTVSSRQLHPYRNQRGLVGLRRTYQFEYTQDMLRREQGYIIMSDYRVDSVVLPAARTSGDLQI